MISLIQDLGQKHNNWQVFSDFVICCACSISNAVDPVHYDEREKMYLECIGKYTHDEAQQFPKMFALLVEIMDEQVECSPGHDDVLGEIYHALELHNKWTGQFFTPGNVAYMMASIDIGENVSDANGKGYITLLEPTCGSGVMVLAASRRLRELKKNPSTDMCVLACDLDLKCTAMAYVQLSLYGIPAVVENADTLLCKTFSRWYTPLYITGGWLFREHMGITTVDGLEDDERLKLTISPMYRALRSIGMNPVITKEKAEGQTVQNNPKALPKPEKALSKLEKVDAPQSFTVTLHETKTGQLSLL